MTSALPSSNQIEGNEGGVITSVGPTYLITQVAMGKSTVKYIKYLYDHLYSGIFLPCRLVGAYGC